MRWIAATIGLILLAMPNIAAAKEKLEPRLQAMMTCQSLTADQARLQCYDQSMSSLTQAVEQGRVVVEAKKGPRGREGVVKASGTQGENRFWIELDNGDRWALLPTTDRDRPPQPGTTVKVRKGMLDSAFWISGEGWSESRADFLGHGS